MDLILNTKAISTLKELSLYKFEYYENNRTRIYAN